MPLYHTLRNSRPGVPKHDSAVLGTRHSPLSVERGSYRKHIVLPTPHKLLRERVKNKKAHLVPCQAQPTPTRIAFKFLSQSRYIPHLQSLIQAPAKQGSPVRRKRHAINRISMVAKRFQQTSRFRLPYADDGAQTARSDKPTIRRDSHRCDTFVCLQDLARLFMTATNYKHAQHNIPWAVHSNWTCSIFSLSYPPNRTR